MIKIEYNYYCIVFRETKFLKHFVLGILKLFIFALEVIRQNFAFYFMNKGTKIAIIFFIVLLYAYAINIVSRYSIENNIAFFRIKQNNEQAFISTLVSNLLNHTCPAANSKININCNPYNSSDNFSYNILAINNISRLWFCNINNFLHHWPLLVFVKYRKCDIIFPFHYFW